MKHIPGVDMSSGSLGQGLSALVGVVLSAKLSHEEYGVYALLEDDEIREGQIWEVVMFAGARKLDNLVVIVDNNGPQIDAAFKMARQTKDRPTAIIAKSIKGKGYPLWKIKPYGIVSALNDE